MAKVELRKWTGVSPCLTAAALTVSPVRLVHGPFGTGKTHTLAALIVSAAERLAGLGLGFRI
jgi:Tfp pilus assembly pilus retraction ATPase PilT